MKWYESLSGLSRERVFSAMRKLRAESDRYYEEARRLSPRGGEIAVGGAHFDAFAKGDAIASFLRALGNGLNPEEAAAAAKGDAKLAAGKWNADHRDKYVHRWEGWQDSRIDEYRRVIESEV